MKYAESTGVAVEKSKGDIERTLKRYGSKSFVCGTQENKAAVIFVLNGKRIQFVLELPKFEDYQYTPSRRKKRSPDEQIKEHEQACRQKWRALLLIIKAKLEAVESGIATLDEEFMAYTLLPNGQTVAKWMIPQIENVYSTHQMPPLLPFYDDEKR